MVYKKIEFSKFISSKSLGLTASDVMTDCERIGTVWGCCADCPVFQMGNCKDAFFENIEKFAKDGDFNDSQFIDIIKLYENQLSNEEIVYLSNIVPLKKQQ